MAFYFLYEFIDAVTARALAETPEHCVVAFANISIFKRFYSFVCGTRSVEIRLNLFGWQIHGPALAYVREIACDFLSRRCVGEQYGTPPVVVGEPRQSVFNSPAVRHSDVRSPAQGCERADAAGWTKHKMLVEEEGVFVAHLLLVPEKNSFPVSVPSE